MVELSRKKKKPKMEFRYYSMPEDRKMFALLGEKWIQYYGRNIDYLHFHNYMEIGYCYEGAGELTMGNRQVRFSGKEFSVIPQNYPHTTNSDENTMSRWEYLFVDVDAFLQDICGGSSLRAEKMAKRLNSKAMFLKEQDYPELGARLRKILDVMRNEEDFYLVEAHGLLAAFLAEVARENPGKGERADGGLEEGKTSAMLARALEYINSHYEEDIKIKELADWCHISETHFRRMFSAYTSMSPLEYINQIRIKNACEYLKKTDDSIGVIAAKCGFTTNSTFNRNFRHLLGVTPMEWRKRPENYEQELLKGSLHSAVCF